VACIDTKPLVVIIKNRSRYEKRMGEFKDYYSVWLPKKHEKARFQESQRHYRNQDQSAQYRSSKSQSSRSRIKSLTKTGQYMYNYLQKSPLKFGRDKTNSWRAACMMCSPKIRVNKKPSHFIGYSGESQDTKIEKYIRNTCSLSVIKAITNANSCAEKAAFYFLIREYNEKFHQKKRGKISLDEIKNLNICNNYWG